MYTVSLIFMKFIMFSILGYVFEMVMCGIIDRKLTNRGFLCGPWIPIYGFGCLAIIWALHNLKDNVILLTILGMLITSLLEYITAWILEEIFHNKWWDYSNEKLNISGYVCLKNSLCFAIGTPLVVIYLDPLVTNMFLEMKDIALYILSIVCFILFIADTIYSVVIAYNLRNRLIVVEELKNDKLAKIPGMLEKQLQKRLKKLKRYPKRLLKSFPNILKSNEKEFEIMKKISSNEKAKRKQKHRKSKK